MRRPRARERYLQLGTGPVHGRAYGINAIRNAPQRRQARKSTANSSIRIAVAGKRAMVLNDQIMACSEGRSVIAVVVYCMLRLLGQETRHGWLRKEEKRSLR